MATTTTTSSNWQGSGTDVRPCKNPACVNPFQDSRYGASKRAKNRCRDGWRCTACGEKEAKAGK